MEYQTTPSRRKSIKGRRVGMAFERKIAKQLGLWWCNDPAAVFRSHLSGGRSTILAADTSLYSGDIIPVKDSAKPWPFSIEIKKSEVFSLDSILLSWGSMFYGFWRQCTRDAKRTQSVPILICGRNRREPYVFFYVHMQQFLLRQDISAPQLILYPGGIKQRGIVCMPLHVFTQAADRQHIEKYQKQLEAICKQS